jgi:hypothetical protein
MVEVISAPRIATRARVARSMVSNFELIAGVAAHDPTTRADPDVKRSCPAPDRVHTLAQRRHRIDAGGAAEGRHRRRRQRHRRDGDRVGSVAS